MFPHFKQCIVINFFRWLLNIASLEHFIGDDKPAGINNHVILKRNSIDTVLG